MPKTYPIDRLSFSALKEYLGNPWRFYRIYVQKIPTFTDSPATLVGKAFHKTLELYYSSPEYRTAAGFENAKEAGLNIIRAAAASVDWGKTGSLEDAEADALQTIKHYFAEDPHYEAMGKLTCERILAGDVKGIPVQLKAVSDLTIEGELIGAGIVDFKKVSMLLEGGIEGDTENPAFSNPTPATYLFQAWFNQKALFAATGLNAKWMIFHEVKTSKNKKGGSQVCKRKIDFASPEWKKIDKAITKMVKAMLRDVSRKGRVWLPNIADQRAADESWSEYLAG